MPAPRFLPDAVFDPAPAGTWVRLVTVGTFVVVVAIMAAAVTRMLFEPHPPPWPVVVSLGVAPALVVAFGFAASLQRYRIAGMKLQIERRFGKVRFSLEGLQSALPDREALRGAGKIVGNDGLRAVAGRFRSKRLGRFHAYVTDNEHAVVLRWPDRCLVISPQQHSLFGETVRKRAGLSR
jgi:hypothetical protein